MFFSLLLLLLLYLNNGFHFLALVETDTSLSTRAGPSVDFNSLVVIFAI